MSYFNNWNVYGTAIRFVCEKYVPITVHMSDCQFVNGQEYYFLTSLRFFSLSRSSHVLMFQFLFFFNLLTIFFLFLSWKGSFYLLESHINNTVYTQLAHHYNQNWAQPFQTFLYQVEMNEKQKRALILFLSLTKFKLFPLFFFRINTLFTRIPPVLLWFFFFSFILRESLKMSQMQMSPGQSKMHCYSFPFAWTAKLYFSIKHFSFLVFLFFKIFFYLKHCNM